MVEKKIHGAEISCGDLLQFDLRRIQSINGNTVALSVEGIAVTGDRTIETLNREVQRCAVSNLSDGYLTLHLLLLPRVGETILLSLNPMIHGDEEIIIGNEHGSNERFPEACDGQTLLLFLDVQDLANMDRILDFSLVIENGDKENAIILVRDGKIVPITALLNIIHLDVFTFVFLKPHHLLGGETVALHLEACIALVYDTNAEL